MRAEIVLALAIVLIAGGCQAAGSASTSTSSTPATTTSTSNAAATTTSTTTSQTEAQGPIVVEFSTMTVDFLDTPIQRWVAIVENPSTNLVFSDVFFEIEIWDTSEDVLQSTVKSTQFMLPKQQMILTGTLEPTAAVASIDINTTWDETYVDSPEALDQWYVTDVVYSDRGTLGWGFKGKLLSSFDRRYLDVEVQVVMRDSSGEIVWASLADVSSISAHDPERWEAPTVIDVPHDSFDTFVMP